MKFGVEKMTIKVKTWTACIYLKNLDGMMLDNKAITTGNW